MSAQSVPRTSAHAQLRFLQRAGVTECSLHRVWQDGRPVDVDGYNYHRARYDDLLDVVLLARDGVVTTVLEAAYTEFTEASR
ncbi:hypothetical protein OB955_23850 [Halobacteria archaeon AArc-m2/3/4]|uniref:RelE toxin-related domain-containing protein n=1 Tax=Natronoglomus mannanivorans TaxID=2979990 RepID=A0ABT2QLB4_9EURY|nr:hypothetical protein [Halobacteria archaeon AArc-m2/3/4]